MRQFPFISVTYKGWKEIFSYEGSGKPTVSAVLPSITRFFWGEQYPQEKPTLRTSSGQLLQPDDVLSSQECTLFDFAQDFSVESYLSFLSPSLAIPCLIELFTKAGFTTQKAFTLLSNPDLENFNAILSERHLPIIPPQLFPLMASHADPVKKFFIIHPTPADPQDHPWCDPSSLDRKYAVNSHYQASDASSLIPIRVSLPSNLSNPEQLFSLLEPDFGHHICRASYVDDQHIEHDIHPGTSLCQLKSGTSIRVAIKTYSADKKRPLIELTKADLQTLSPVFVEKLIGSLRSGAEFSYTSVLNILRTVRTRLAQLPNVTHAVAPSKCRVVLVGDIHGQFYDLYHIFESLGFPSEDRLYVFNGDWVDRGRYSVESVLSIFLLFLCHPTRVYLNRGNHESRWCTCDYGFSKELIDKYALCYKPLYNEFHLTFVQLPLMTVVNDSIAVVHGGLPANAGTLTLEEINKENRVSEIFIKGSLIESLLWSDPGPTLGYKPSFRGFGVEFGPDLTCEFLKLNNLDRIFRSHEIANGGYTSLHNDRLVTVFSCPNYQDLNNLGAVVVLTVDEDTNRLDLDYKPVTFKRAAETYRRPDYFATGGCCLM
ncbi:hypothetical protein RCL1_009140 [Eukaryota sp. TZLM3-RCL]